MNKLNNLKALNCITDGHNETKTGYHMINKRKLRMQDLRLAKRTTHHKHD